MRRGHPHHCSVTWGFSINAATKREIRLYVIVFVAIVLGVSIGMVVYDTTHDDSPPVDHTPPARLLGAHVATGADVKASADAFGIREIAHTRPGGEVWAADWTGTRTFTGVDPQDPWFDADHGEATYRVADGRLYISGSVPRMFVHDPALQHQWGDVEITMYFKRIADAGVPYAGMTAVARANHGMTGADTEDLCDTRGYGARMRYDGNVDFEKETSHPHNQSIALRDLFHGPMPHGKWLGFKYLVYDADDGVHLETYLDTTNGADGGDWRMVDSHVDDGNGWGTIACAPGIDPAMALTNAATRLGSESGKPNISVYFRSDGVAPDGLVYKWGSVREITARTK